MYPPNSAAAKRRIPIVVKRWLRVSTNMLTDPVTLAGDSSSTRDYALRSIVNGQSLRGVAAPVSPITNETLTIGSTASKKGGITTDRHLIRFDRSYLNGTGLTANLAMYVVIEVPRDATVTQAIIKDVRTQLTNLLANATLVKILNNEP